MPGWRPRGQPLRADKTQFLLAALLPRLLGFKLVSALQQHPLLAIYTFLGLDFLVPLFWSAKHFPPSGTHFALPA